MTQGEVIKKTGYRSVRNPILHVMWIVGTFALMMWPYYRMEYGVTEYVVANTVIISDPITLPIFALHWAVALIWFIALWTFGANAKK